MFFKRRSERHVLMTGPAGLLGLCLLLMPSWTRADAQAKGVLHVAAAADLTPVMPVLAQQYERKTGVRIVFTTGSSAEQVARIEAGEAVDLFLGSDFTFPEKLVADGLTDAKAPEPYASGTLVLFARKDSPLQPLSLESLQDGRLRSLAIADQLHAPYGRAATDALNRLKLTSRVQSKLVIAPNVADAAALVEKGKADAGLISLTVAKSAYYASFGTYVLIPASQYPEIKEYAVVLRKGNTAAARQFLTWLLSAELQGKLPNIGLDPVR